MTDTRRRWQLASLASVLAIFDGLATYVLLRTGLAEEGNALLARVIEQLGPATGLGVRTVVVVALIAGLAVLVPRTRLARTGLALVTVVFGGVAVYHVLGSAIVVATTAI